MIFDPSAIDAKSSLGDKQRLFMWCAGQLIAYAYNQGLALTAGDFARKDNQGHMSGSLHYDRLAADVNVFMFTIEGRWEYLDSYHENPEAWDLLGTFWLSLHPLCRWGGNFTSRDLNHFSVTNWGRA